MENQENEQSNPHFWIDLIFDFCVVGISFALLYFLT